jgi:hypothetical protein
MEQRMSRAAFSLKIYAICFGAAGFGLLVAPNPLLPLFGFPTTEEVWIHLIGLLMVSLATYDYIAGQNGLAPIIAASIPTRLVAGAVMILTWILEIVGPGILFFAAHRQQRGESADDVDRGEEQDAGADNLEDPGEDHHRAGHQPRGD